MDSYITSDNERQGQYRNELKYEWPKGKFENVKRQNEKNLKFYRPKVYFNLKYCIPNFFLIKNEMKK